MFESGSQSSTTQAQEAAAGEMMTVPKDRPNPRGISWLESCRLAGTMRWNLEKEDDR